MTRLALVIIIPLMLAGCASPDGADPMLADFNKYDHNYAAFPTDRLTIGEPKGALVAALGDGTATTVEAGAGYEVLAFQRWKAVAGPDYVDQTLYVRLDAGAVSHWKITNDAVAVVPSAW